MKITSKEINEFKMVISKNAWRVSCHAFLFLLLFECVPNFSMASTIEKSKAIKVKPISLTKEQAAAVRKELLKKESAYDEKESMLSSPFSSPGYHTTLKGGRIHSTLASLGYALNLLDANQENLTNRAIKIIEKVVSLQDTNRLSKTFGIWSWYLEEPLDKMNPPDQNWADFCGTKLLEIVINHGQSLPASTSKKMEIAIINAAKEIEKRDVKPSYTNIALMGTFVTLMAGEVYEIPEIKKYATERLDRFYNYTKSENGFTEYNSPTYTKVAVDILNKMRYYTTDTLVLKKVNELYEKAWREIALHYHASTHQWSGPHSRCYNTLLTDDISRFIDNANAKTGDERFSLDNYRYHDSISDGLKSFFINANATRLVVDTFKKSYPSLIGTTYITPKYAIGSINQSDMWNQRRNLIAYWGSGNKVAALQLRFLHDGYDFSSAIFKGVQDENSIVGAISFITNGGDIHPSLDKVKGATIKAKELKLRFEFTGYGASSILLKNNEDITGYSDVILNDVFIALAVPYAVFDDFKIERIYGYDKNKSWIDFVFYKGEERLFQIDKIEKAATAIALTISDYPINNYPKMDVSIEEGLMSVKWDKLSIESPIKPYKNK